MARAPRTIRRFAHCNSTYLRLVWLEHVTAEVKTATVQTSRTFHVPVLQVPILKVQASRQSGDVTECRPQDVCGRALAQMPGDPTLPYVPYHFVCTRRVPLYRVGPLAE